MTVQNVLNDIFEQFLPGPIVGRALVEPGRGGAAGGDYGVGGCGEAPAAQ